MTGKVVNAVFPQITNTVSGQFFPLKELRVRGNLAEILSLKAEYSTRLSEVQSDGLKLKNDFGVRVCNNKQTELSLHLWNPPQKKELPNRQLRWRIKQHADTQPSHVVFVMMPLGVVATNHQLSNGLLVSNILSTLQMAKQINASCLLDEVIETEIKRLEINIRFQLLRGTIVELDQLLEHTKMMQRFQLKHDE